MLTGGIGCTRLSSSFLSALFFVRGADHSASASKAWQAQQRWPWSGADNGARSYARCTYLHAGHACVQVCVQVCVHRIVFEDESMLFRSRPRPHSQLTASVAGGGAWLFVFWRGWRPHWHALAHRFLCLARPAWLGSRSSRPVASGVHSHIHMRLPPSLCHANGERG